MEAIRINKYLAQSGYCSRREADRMIEEGKVTINGKKAKLGSKIIEGDEVRANGHEVKTAIKKIYIAFHKPFGVITTTDKKASNTVMDYVNIPERVYPMGRLDVESSGLILLTNDGDIVNKLLKSKNRNEKEYLVTVDKQITPEMLKKLESGITIDNYQKTLPAKVDKINSHQFSIIIVQGLNRQVRRMCEAVGLQVKILKRVRIMNIQLGDLARGKWRYLTEEEIDTFLNELNKNDPKDRIPLKYAKSTKPRWTPRPTEKLQAKIQAGKSGEKLTGKPQSKFTPKRKSSFKKSHKPLSYKNVQQSRNSNRRRNKR